MIRGVISAVNGPIVHASGMEQAGMMDLVEVGHLGLIGEIIRFEKGLATIQVYENDEGLKPGEPVISSGMPMSIALGPGLIGGIYDGIQRPLAVLEEQSGSFLARGEKVFPLAAAKQWLLEPVAAAGTMVTGGTLLFEFDETALVRHRILVPPGVAGVLEYIAPAGPRGVTDEVYRIRRADGSVYSGKAFHWWPARHGRPYAAKRAVDRPLLTGQRIIDTFFPISKGGVAAIPGGFGTGKTMTQHALAKWCDADIIVYIGCGERGNEMTEVLREFPEIRDPKSGRPLMDRTILIANTSNMPVAAREVSIYTGITLAEYYRDQGRSVAVFADSTSRWAEALRELAARLEEMPAEEGFPATLPTRLAQFYERAGSVATLAGDRGAISIVGAVSPPGGDFSEPVTQHTQRFIRCFWALDTELANARHYPSIHWLRSYSGYAEDVAAWWERHAPDWSALRAEALEILQREERLQQIVKLVGPDVLPDSQRLILFAAELLKDGFLTQSAFDANDMYCSPARQTALLRLILGLYRQAREIIQHGAPLLRIQQLPSVPGIVRAKSAFGNDALAGLEQLEQDVTRELATLAREYQK